MLAEINPARGPGRLPSMATARRNRAPARVLIVPDKFKGTLAAPDACAAIAAGWKSARPGDRLDLLPMSDGGDGFGEIMGVLLNAQPRTARACDAARRPLTACWWWQPAQKLAVIDSAGVIGLALLPPKKFHPFQLDTFGLGAVLEAAVKQGAEQCLIGIGGSATNDGGFGLARALGWKFLDQNEGELEQWWQLTRLAEVVPPAAPLPLKVTVAVDVLNPLLGPRGCSCVYGPQKGLAPEELAFAETCLRQYSRVLGRQRLSAHAKTPGAGAAGGLGFGLLTFAGAAVRPGFEAFAEAARLEIRMRHSDLVITGEGAIDRQTFMGKGVGQVARLCDKLKTPFIALAGTVSDRAKIARHFTAVSALTDITTVEQAQKRPAHHLQELAALVARDGQA